MAVSPAGFQDFCFGSPNVSSRNMPLQALSGGRLMQRFHCWAGQSGRRYICSVFLAKDNAAMESVRHYAGAVVLAVKHDGRGQKTLLAVVEIGGFPELFWHGGALSRLVCAGVDEFHVHLMAETAAARAATVADIEAHTTH